MSAKALAGAASLTNLKVHERLIFGRYRGHPVAVHEQKAMEGNQWIFQVLLRADALQGVAGALQDGELVKGAGLKPRQVSLDANSRLLLYARTPVVRSPKPEEVKETLDALVVLADAGGEGLGDRCEKDDGPAPRLVLVNGRPTQLCDPDFKKLEEQFGSVRAAVGEVKPAYGRGIAFGILGFALGSLIWAGILIVSGFIFSLAAIAIAAIIGVLVMKGARKPSYGLIGIMAIFTLAAILIGEILWVAVLIVQLGGPFDLALGFEGFLFLVGEDPGGLGLSFFFALLGVIFVGLYMFRTTRAARPRFEVIA